MKTEVKMNSEKRFIICSLLIIGLSLTSNFQDFAANKPTIYINGEKIHTKTAPVILKGTTYVPLRDISENMGCTVTWDAKTATVKIVENSSKKTILIEKNSYTANGKKTALNPGTMNKNGTTLETVALLSKLDVDKHIDVEIKLDELDLTSAESKATYAQIKEYILEKFDLKVSTLYIAQIKKKCGIILREHYNKSKKEKQVIPQCTPEKEEAIMDALKHFKMI